MLYAIIMAGGSGTRLWPESRRNCPKQLMTFLGNRSFLQSTVDRLRPLVPPERIGVVTGERLKDRIAEQLPELSAGSILVEPCARNTSGCIALAAIWCLAQDPEAVMVLLPSDHVIQPKEAFQETVAQAAEIVRENPEKLVTLGITPTCPAETFGYIERGEKGPGNSLTVRQFREKPDARTAAEYLESGNFYWNAGIFIWRASTILENLQKYAPGVWKPVEKILKSAKHSDFENILKSEFPEIENISIDYAVMEKAAADGNVLVLPAQFEWDDVGSWRALERHFPRDAAGNTLALAEGTPEAVLVETQNCTVRSTDPGKTLVCYGVENLAVIVTPEVVLVFDRNREESVREVVQKLKEMNCEELL